MDTATTDAGMAGHEVLGLPYELAQGLSLLLFVFAALMFLLVVMAVMKRRARGDKALPGAGIVLLAIGVVSFGAAMLLKVL
jgi:predicted membrane channel-forming protein YqfA (hemolysin III family)